MRPHRMLLVAAALLVLASACGDSPQVPRGGTVGPGRVFMLAIGDKARIEGTGVTVTLQDVRNDSRCAENAECAWPGDATVVITVAGAPGMPAKRELHAADMAHLPESSSPRPDHDGDSRTASIGGYMLRLDELEPPNMVGSEIPRSDYRGRFTVVQA